MMDCQIQSTSSINLRSKGLSMSSGRIYKGCVKDAATKLSIGSIPSTYQSIIYKNETYQAFGTSQQRFYKKSKSPYQQIMDYQNNSEIETQATKSCISNNNKSPNIVGYGPLISKAKRQWMRTINTPGPGKYNHQSTLQQAKIRKCITKQEHRKKKYELFSNLDSPNKNNLLQTSNKKQSVSGPGPCQYFEQKKQHWKSANKGWKSSFQTAVGRDNYIPNSISPGPGVYEVSPKAMKSKQKENGKSAQNKENQDVIQAKKLKNNKFLKNIIGEQKYDVPGPGTYQHQLPDFKPLYQKIKISKNFMNPSHPTKANKNSPGPTKYNVKRMYDDITPKLLQSAFFMSECKRQLFDASNLSPGPTLLPVPLNSKKKFHFNIKNQWL